MSILITVVIVFAAIWFAFRLNVVLGIIVSVGAVAVWYYSNYANLMTGRANAEFNKKNYDKAMSYYEKAYKSKGRKFTVDISYAQALLRTGNPEKALEIINKILELRVTDEIKKNAKQTRCMINYKLGNLDEAYEEAWEMFDDGFRTSNMYCLVGFLKLLKNMPIDETLEFCEKAYDYDSDNRDNVDNLIVCYLRKGDYEKAYDLAKDLTNAFPEFVEGWYHGAIALKNLGNIDEAAEYASKIKDCTRTYMTTVSQEQVDSLLSELQKN